MPWRHKCRRRYIAPQEASGQLALPGKELRYPFNRKLGRPQDWSGRFEDEENILSSTGIRTPIRQTSDCNNYAIPAICPYIIILLLLLLLLLLILLKYQSIQQRLIRRPVVVSVQASYLERIRVRTSAKDRAELFYVVYERYSRLN